MKFKDGMVGIFGGGGAGVSPWARSTMLGAGAAVCEQAAARVASAIPPKMQWDRLA
jgi:hypothetical protein